MKTNPLKQLLDCGQSVWMDTISRDLIASGELRRMVRTDGIRGVTSNPDILQKAIVGSRLYDAQIARLARAGRSTLEIYEALAVEDIRKAADVLKPVFEESKGYNGYISLEVSPYLAYDPEGTIEEAHRLWRTVNRPNLLIKVPATPECIPAVAQLIEDGVNVNVTLIFSLEGYEAVMGAYLSGLEKRVEAGKPVDRVFSVASFFLSRIDTLVDTLLGNRVNAHPAPGVPRPQDLMGKIAVACAKVAYANFKAAFSGPRFDALRGKGARPQRPLWASTSTKNPLYSDTMYVAPLIGPHTINTLPMQTIDAWRDHGAALPNTIEAGVEEARQAIADLEALGIDLASACWQLQEEGIAKFTRPFDNLLSSISQKRATALGWGDSQVEPGGRHDAIVVPVCAALNESQFVPRLWMEDAALWTQDPKVASTIENRLGWLRSARMMQTATGELKRFAKETCKAGFKHVVLLGMGGSSLCPEVCARTFGSRNRFPELIVLDNTSPDAVKAVEKQIDLKSTLFIPASKSGTTIETNSFYKYFKGRLASAGVKKPGAHFIAITDPGSPLVELARKDKFRRLFENPADIGGRFSALSFFGLVPMALLGIDVEELLKRSVAFTQDGGDIVPVQANQPVRLGAALATWAKAGRDKVTFSLSPRLASFGDWVEQLVAESTGKQGVGILPVVGERTALPSAYGKDRVFVSIRLANEKDDESRLEALEKAGAPVVRIVLGSAVDLGAEFLRWEIATATMGALLGINPFDEPNVSESKQNSSAILNQFAEQRKLPVPAANLIDGGLAITFSGAAKRAIGSKISRARDALRVLAASATEGEYVALLAFLHATKRVETRLANIRAALRNSTHRATTLGYGPRYLHSTGQFHKGGPNSGIFFMFTADPAADMEIPGEPYSFAVLARAQALGDFRSLDSHGRRAVLIHLGSDVEAGLKRFAALLGVQA